MYRSQNRIHNIIYFSSSHYHWITRKDSLTKLTDIYCDKIKQQRLNEYRETLEAKQLEFLEKKLQNLEFIRKEQLECQVKCTVSQEDIESARQQYEMVKMREDQKRQAQEEAELNMAYS